MSNDKPDIKKIMDEVPDYAKLSHAAETHRYDPDGGFDTENDSMRHVFQIQFGKQGFGFGEITFVSQDGHLMIDTEHMSKATVKEFLSKLVDSAILDTDKDPERHAIFNRCFGRKCGEGCEVCHPKNDGV